jgi:RNA binding activity-knot of a chromodomain
MLSPFRLAGIITVILAVCGPARAQAIAPAGSGVTIDKIAIDNGLAHTVKYVVKGGSPRLQALVRRVEWAENELSVVEQLQLLKLDTVVNERRVAAFRTAQLTNPDYPPGFLPLSIAIVNGGDGESSLQGALKRQLAHEATPEAALELIGFLEDLQTQLDAELKALPPQEKEAAQGPIDALRPRVAALPRRDVPPPRPQPVVPRQVRFPAQAVPQQLPMPLEPVAFQQRVRQNQAEVEWHGTWWAAEVVKTNGDRYYIHYTGWDNSWDEWVGPDRIRMPVAKQ